MTETLWKFIQEHRGDDLSAILLSASRYEGVDVKLAVGQIKARNQIKDKLPSWYDNDRLFFPSTLAAEQCSSEITALYKQRFVYSDDWLCDLTGGLGVDTYYFSQKIRCVTYTEKEAIYCDAARDNMHWLGVSNVDIINDDAVKLITKNDERIAGVNVFYIDPARRGVGNKRLFAISDCEPDLTEIWPLLHERQCRIIVKLSPMLDITQVLNQLPDVCEIHVISVRNDCKELLMVTGSLLLPETGVSGHGESGMISDNDIVENAIRRDQSEPEIVCVNYTSAGMEQFFRFYMSDEHAAVVDLAGAIGRFLYEPNSSILKAGAYKSVALHYGIEKLHASSHLYTSDHLLSFFPGRIFEVVDVIPFNNRICKKLSEGIPQANISVRNFPVSADELRKRTRIADGGDVYLFATTLSGNEKVLIRCRKV